MVLRKWGKKHQISAFRFLKDVAHFPCKSYTNAIDIGRVPEKRLFRLALADVPQLAGSVDGSGDKGLLVGRQ